MGETTQDWSNLARNVRDTGVDYFNSELGVAKFMDEAATNKLKRDELDTKIAQDKLKLNATTKAEAELDVPVTVHQLAGIIDPNTSTPLKVNMLANADKTLQAMNMKVGPDGTIIGPTGVVTKRNFDPIASAFIGTVGLNISLDDATNERMHQIGINRQKLAEKSDTDIDPAEKQAQISKLNAEAAQVQAAHTEMKDNKTERAGIAMQGYYTDKLTRALAYQGNFMAAGAPGAAKLLDPIIEDAKKGIEDTRKNNLEKLGWLPVPAQAVKEFGLLPGQMVPKETLDAIIHGLATLKAQREKAGADKSQANYATLINGVVKGALDSTEKLSKEYAKDIDGNYITNLDKNGFETKEWRKMTEKEINFRHNKNLKEQTQQMFDQMTAIANTSRGRGAPKFDNNPAAGPGGGDPAITSRVQQINNIAESLTNENERKQLLDSVKKTITDGGNVSSKLDAIIAGRQNKGVVPGTAKITSVTDPLFYEPSDIRSQGLKKVYSPDLEEAQRWAPTLFP